jgi:hypothetical protein
MSGLMDALGQLTAGVTAVAALGTAASGLTDATKVFNGGISNAGFGRIEAALTPFQSALQTASADWRRVIWASWVNGVAKEDQKAQAKSLIRLGLSADNADALAAAGRVDAAAFRTTLTAVQTGAALTAEQVSLLARFNGAIDAAMDGGFEEADQKYRNWSKLVSGLVAVALAVWGGGLIDANLTDHAKTFGQYLFTPDFWRAVLVGVIAVPLAPVAKDLTSAVQAAVTAMKST